MRKNLVIVFAITALFGTSCSNEVEMNSPLRKEEILPTPMAIILSNYTYSDRVKMGRVPKDLSKPGFAWTLSGSTVTLKTAATLFKYA